MLSNHPNALPTSAELPPATNPAAVPTHPNVSREFVDDDQIVIYRVNSLLRTAADGYYEIVKYTLLHWPADRPYLGISELVLDNVFALTPYAQHVLKQLQGVRPDLHGFTAIVMPRGIIFSLVMFFMRGTPHPHRPHELFNSRAAALAWLRRKSGAAQPPPVETAADSA